MIGEQKKRDPFDVEPSACVELIRDSRLQTAGADLFLNPFAEPLHFPVQRTLPASFGMTGAIQLPQQPFEQLLFPPGKVARLEVDILHFLIVGTDDQSDRAVRQPEPISGANPVTRFQTDVLPCGFPFAERQSRRHNRRAQQRFQFRSPGQLHRNAPIRTRILLL